MRWHKQKAHAPRLRRVSKHLQYRVLLCALCYKRWRQYAAFDADGFGYGGHNGESVHRIANPERCTTYCSSSIPHVMYIQVSLSLPLLPARRSPTASPLAICTMYVFVADVSNHPRVCLDANAADSWQECVPLFETLLRVYLQMQLDQLHRSPF